MVGPIRKAADDWQQKAIAKCMEDPEYAAKVNGAAPPRLNEKRAASPEGPAAK